MLVWLLLLAGSVGVAASEPIVVASPDGRVALTIELKDGRVTYAVAFSGRTVIRPSALGLVPEGAARLDSRFQQTAARRTGRRDSWRPPYGERSEIPDRFNALEVDFKEAIPPARILTIEFRAYDEGIAFRYRAPSSMVIGDEATEFRLPEGAFGWETPVAQTLYRRLPIQEISRASERPFLVELPGGLWAAIAEAGVENYPSMFLTTLRSERHSLGAKLMGSACVSAPYTSPWRVILVGDRPGDLLEHNYLLQNLSPPSRVTPTDWIKPGKVLREVTLSTRGGREAVDFAVRHGLQYIEYDAGWYGHEYDEESDATRVSVDPRRLRKEPEYQGLDLQNVIGYAKSKGIGVWVYVNRRAMERQLDTILPLYRKWGVAGVKYGFVNVHTQEWTRWLYDAIAKAASHRLMLDIHDEFRPTGMSRTYPNLLTQEGILGNEGMPDATHSTILPFTRMLAGAGDYTYCWLDPRLKNTWGHQLALSVVLYSPLQFIYWYDRPVAFQTESPGMQWFKTLPTVWDDTRVIDGRPGESAAIARRKGTTWYVGAITNNDARDLKLPLEMLDAGVEYTAAIYSDGDGPRDIRVTQSKVKRGDVLEWKLHARGGAAAMLSAAGK